MIDFCAAHDIVSDIEMVPIQAVNEAYERLLKNDVHYRFVIDMNRSARKRRSLVTQVLHSLLAPFDKLIE